MATSSQAPQIDATVENVRSSDRPLDRTPICPAWCEEADCRGEHAQISADPIPATADLPRFMSSGEGVCFPTVSVRLVWDVIDHLPPGVSLYIASDRDAAEATLALHEAESLAQDLGRAIEKLRETAGAHA